MTEPKQDDAPQPQAELSDEQLDAAVGGATKSIKDGTSNITDGTSNTILVAEIYK